MSDMLMRWLLERMLPSAMQKAFLKRLPVELGRYLLSVTEPIEFQTEIKLTGTPLSGLRESTPRLAREYGLKPPRTPVYDDSVYDESWNTSVSGFFGPAH